MNSSWTRKRCNHKKEIDMFAPNWKMESLFSLMVMSLYIMSLCESGLSVHYSKRKKQLKVALEGERREKHENPHFQNSKESIKTGVYFSHFFKHFAREAGSSPQWQGVCNSKVSTGQESTLYSWVKRCTVKVRSLPQKYNTGTWATFILRPVPKPQDYSVSFRLQSNNQ